MKFLRLGAGAVNQTPLDISGNVQRIIQVIEAAKKAEVSVLCLPELAITGYGCEDGFFLPHVRAKALDALDEIAAVTKGLVVGVGLPIEYKGALYNCVAMLGDDGLLGISAKHSLAGDGIHYEPRWFKSWPEGHQTKLNVGGRDVPLGDLRFDIGGIKLGFEICEDAWAAERKGAALARDGVDVILNPSASHFAFGKRDTRRRLVQEGSRAFGAAYVYANLLGNEAGRAIYDGHLLVSAKGKINRESERLRFIDTDLIWADVDIDDVRSSRTAIASFRSDLTEDESEWVPSAQTLKVVSQPELATPKSASWETSPQLKFEEFSRAVALGLYDYVRKSRAKGFVVSLSGGADSSAVSVLCYLAYTWAKAGYGPQSYLKEPFARTLTTLYQKTKQSGPVTQSAASAVAHELGASHFELDAETLVAGYVGQVQQALGRNLSWESDDVALQNIQARVRAPSAWLIANVEQKLLLTTSNRSEAAVGYATMDGDTAGGLAPIGGIDKAFLREWLRWMQSSGPTGLRPFASLEKVNVQAPTAELRPASMSQTDEHDLMPYEFLDWVERSLVSDHKSPADIKMLAPSLFPQHPTEQLSTWVDRFFRLFSMNQWKRERYAPSFHIDDESLDPKTFFRFPVLSGGLL